MLHLAILLIMFEECMSLTYEYIPEYRDPPSFRMYLAGTYSSYIDSLVVFGGHYQPGQNYNELWTYSLSESRWYKQSSSNRVSPSNCYLGERFTHGMFSMEDGKYSCIFGGNTDYGPLNDLWCFSFSSLTVIFKKWSEISTSGDEVEARYRFSYAAYTYTDGKSYFAVFAGNSSNGKLNDMCILDLSTLIWTCYTPASAPYKRFGGTMQYYNGFLYIVGGNSEVYLSKIEDFYRFNLATLEWEDVTRPNTYVGVSLVSSLIYQSYFYIFFGYSRIEGVNMPGIFRADLDADFEWTEVDNIPSIAREAYALAVKDSKAYLFGGKTYGEIINDLVIFDLSKSPLEFTKTDNLATPPLRAYHSFDPIYGSLYLFGGDSEGQKLSDFWAYDITQEKWSNLKTTGSPPSARSDYGSAFMGDSLIIWGGVGELGYLNDMFKYSVNTNSWEELVSVSSSVPTPRASMCVVLANPYIYLYGGITNAGLNSELWRYDIGLQEYELLDSNSSDGPLGINKHKCSIENNANDVLFYVMFGTGEGKEHKGEVHYFSINQKKWTFVHKSDTARNGASVNKVNDKIVVAGGETWGTTPRKHMFIIDLSSCSEHKCNEIELKELNDFFLNGASTFYLNYVYFHGGSSTVSDIIRANVPNNYFYTIDLSAYLDCSLGSELINSKCVFCKKGFYKEVYNTNCIPCEKGFYNALEGSSSFRQCFPCEEGTFNPYEGAQYCLDCPAHAVCPLGASEYGYQRVQSYDKSDQPDFYEYRTEEASNITLLLVVVIAFLGSIVIAVFLFWKKLHTFLINLDMFDSLHTFGVGNVVTLTKNKIGGIFTIVFFIAALILVVSSVPSYAIDNLIETKTLVPYIIVEEDYNFASELTVSVDLSGYYAPCVESSDQCHSSINLTLLNIDQGGEVSHKCIESGDNCKIEFECHQCSIQSTSYLELSLSHPNSYSSGIRVNLTSSSSIPEKFSSVSYTINSESGSVFRGKTASQFFFSMVSSIYKNSMTAEENTGYHALMTKNPILGSTYSTLDLTFSSNLNVLIEFSRSENCLMTLHDEKYPLTILVFTLLGSVSGALGAIGAGMSMTEKFFARAKQRSENDGKGNELMKLRRNYKIFLQDEPKAERKTLDYTRIKRRKWKDLANRYHIKSENKIDEFD